MAYRANVGGIMGSGEYMPSAPQIDVAGAITAASNAFRTTRESAVQRALMVAQAQREQEASRLSQAQAATNGVMPTSAAHAYVQSNNDAYEAANAPPAAPADGSAPGPALTAPTMPPPVANGLPGAPTPRLVMPGASASAPALSSPAPAASLPAGSTTGAGGRPMMTAPITGHGSRRLSTPIDLGNGYSVIPELTPAAREYEMMNERLRAMEGIGAGHDAARVTVAQGHDSTSTANTTARVTASTENHNTPSASTVYSADHRRPPAATDPDVQDGERAKFVLGRIATLTKATKGLGGLTKPGMSLDDATHQANVEWAAAHGTVPPPRAVVPAAPSDESGPGAQTDYNSAAAKYQQALHLGIDPALAREAYNTDVMAIAKKHGHR